MPYSIYQVVPQQAGQVLWIKHQPVNVYILSRFFYIKISVISNAVSRDRECGGETPLPLTLLGVTEDVLLFAFHLGKVKFRARHSPVDVLDVVAGGLKVGCGVIRAGHKNLERG